MPLSSLKDKLSSRSYSVAFGEVVKINATIITAHGLKVSISDMVKIVSNTNSQETVGMVTEIDGSTFYITPFSFVEGLYLPMNVEVFFSLKESDRFNDKIRISPGIGYKFENGWKTEFYISYHNAKDTNSVGNTTNDLVFRLRVFRSFITSKKNVSDKEKELKELMEIE